MPPLLSRKNTLALLAACLSSLMFGLEISSVPAILPTLEHLLGGDFKDIQWVMNAYTIACTTVLMATGTIADRFGRKRVFVVSIALFGVTSLLCGLAANMAVLIAGRFLQGASGGAMLICQVAVLSHQFRQPRERVNAFAAWGIIFGIGLGFGPIIGSATAALVGWQWVFLVHAPLALATIALAASGVSESRDPHAQKLDAWGAATLSLALFGLAFYITQGADLGFTSLSALGIVAMSALCLIAFVVAENMSAHPMFDFSVFRIRAFSGALIGSAAMNFSFWPFMIYLPVYFHNALCYDDLRAGLALLAYTLPTLVVPPVAERLAYRYRPVYVIPGGLFTIGVGFFLMRIGSVAERASWITMLPGCVIAGVGLGLTNTTVTNTTTGAVPSARAGMASGIDMSARMIALAINIALMGFVLVAGVDASLSRTLAGAHDAAQIHALSVAIAAGHSVALDQKTAHDALVRGFGWVMLYGGAGVWILAAASFLTFGAAASLRQHGEAQATTRAQCAD
ncbi:MFS transporter [Paraburkholderia diazotrophica]|uniref:Drug resistance transporter, EmrB/QacA subfamily n=1 Tax=Paraburkholderia diazotrophica TaxID=667676 RepID=A0A1H7BBG2_9BURK|nr:MFS transporter [Paraburkholderia diazotrophica]SEJ74254.1 drug resistance transporter, EmrB/QacA subfamily [Paraburkholderia diazotrophica]